MWWIKQKMQEENLSFPLPGTLALRKEAEEARAAAVGARTEAEARRIIGAVNDKIRESYGKTLSGPPLTQPLLDVEEVVGDWRALHPVEEKPAPEPLRRPGSEPPRRGRSFFQWIRRG